MPAAVLGFFLVNFVPEKKLSKQHSEDIQGYHNALSMHCGPKHTALFCLDSQPALEKIKLKSLVKGHREKQLLSTGREQMSLLFSKTGGKGRSNRLTSVTGRLMKKLTLEIISICTRDAMVIRNSQRLNYQGKVMLNQPDCHPQEDKVTSLAVLQVLSVLTSVRLLTLPAITLPWTS